MKHNLTKKRLTNAGWTGSPPGARSSATVPDNSSVTDVEVSGLDEPALVGEDHHLGTVAQAELGEDARHVRLHCRGSDEELVRDLSVARPTRDRNQYLTLPVGQPFQAARRGGVDSEALG